MPTVFNAQVKNALSSGCKRKVSRVISAFGCGFSQSVLLMPEATRPIGVDEQVLETFMQEMRIVCKRELGLDWATTPRNVGVYKRRLVALDFGTPEPEEW